jgi:hypothetical protein
MSRRESEAASTKDRHGLKPVRMKPRTAAKHLDIGYDSMLDLIHRGLFTVFDNGKRGRERRIHVPTEEVEIYGAKGEEALREHRAKKKRTKR